MSVIYHLYSNNGLGGPVDYSAPIATTASLSFTTPGLPPSSDSTFAVRAFDPGSGLEEANTEARVRIVIDAGGNDVTNRPNAPFALSVLATAGGGCRASWAYTAAGQAAPPDGFYVYLVPGTSASYLSPAASVAYTPGRSGYYCDLSGLVDGSTYSAAVRAYNATGIETNTTAVAPVIGVSTPPNNVDDLSVATTFASS